jgi:hypothetical protein
MNRSGYWRSILLSEALKVSGGMCHAVVSFSIPKISFVFVEKSFPWAEFSSRALILSSLFPYLGTDGSAMAFVLSCFDEEALII